MRTFKDDEGRQWAVAVNTTQIKRVRAATGVDIFTLADDGMRPFAVLLADVVKTVDVVYVLCRDEADRRGVTDEDFGRALAGETLAAAVDAFTDAVIDFFPPARREILRRAMELGRAVAAGQHERMAAALRGLTPADVTPAAPPEPQGPKPSPGNSPESAGSTPAP